MTTLNVIFKHVEMILAGNLLHYYLPIFGFTLIYQEGVNYENIVAHFKEHVDVDPIIGQSLANVQLYHCLLLS